MIDWLLAALGAALSYTGFCRAVAMSASTLPAIRHSFAALCAAGAAVALAALFRPDVLTWSLIGLLAAMLLVQLATARYWRPGVPSSFTRGGQ